MRAVGEGVGQGRLGWVGPRVLPPSPGMRWVQRQKAVLGGRLSGARVRSGLLTVQVLAEVTLGLRGRPSALPLSPTDAHLHTPRRGPPHPDTDLPIPTRTSTRQLAPQHPDTYLHTPRGVDSWGRIVGSGETWEKFLQVKK